MKKIETQDPLYIDTNLLAQEQLLQSRRVAWQDARQYAEPVVRALQELGLEPTLSGDIDLSFAGDKERLAAVFRILRAGGYVLEPRAQRPKIGDPQWIARFYHPKSTLPFWVNFSSTVCRRVQVGTRLQEVPVFETICDEPEKLPEAPQSLIDDIPF